MHQRDNFHLIKQHAVNDAIGRHMNLSYIQIQCLMDWMSHMRMKRENIRSFDDSGCHPIRIKRRIFGDVGPNGSQIFPCLAGPENIHATPNSRLMLACE